MKKLFTLLCATLALTSINAQLLTENFSASGALTANGWTAHSGAGTNVISTAGVTGLSFTGYVGSGVGSTGNAAALVQNGEDCNKALTTAQTTGVTYYSFLIKPTAVAVPVPGAAVSDYVTGFYTTSSTFPLRVFIKADASPSNFEFGISRGNGLMTDSTNNDYVLGNTYLVTVKYEFVAGATNDIVSMYVQSTGAAFATEPAVPTLTYSGATGPEATASGLVSVFLRQGTTANGVNVVIDELRVANTWKDVIPVEMVSFTAKKANNTNKLAWQTATELNNQHFDVQRSTDGATFQSIGQVKGVGTSVAVNDYEFMDEAPALGTNYYRLQQVDFNGKTTTSKTVAVGSTGKGSAKVFPTLATDKINVLTTSDKEETFTITNMVGQTVLSGRVVNSLDINVSQLAKGIYILQVAGDAVRFSRQ